MYCKQEHQELTPSNGVHQERYAQSETLARGSQIKFVIQKKSLKHMHLHVSFEIINCLLTHTVLYCYHYEFVFLTIRSLYKISLCLDVLHPSPSTFVLQKIAKSS